MGMIRLVLRRIHTNISLDDILKFSLTVMLLALSCHLHVLDGDR